MYKSFLLSICPHCKAELNYVLYDKNDCELFCPNCKKTHQLRWKDKNSLCDEIKISDLIDWIQLEEKRHVPTREMAIGGNQVLGNLKLFIKEKQNKS